MKDFYLEASELLSKSEMFEIQGGNGGDSGSQVDVCHDGCVVACAHCISCVRCTACSSVAIDIFPKGPMIAQEM